MNNTDDPEVLDIMPLLSAAERGRGEIMLARVLLVAIRRRAFLAVR